MRYRPADTNDSLARGLSLTDAGRENLCLHASELATKALAINGVHIRVDEPKSLDMNGSADMAKLYGAKFATKSASDSAGTKDASVGRSDMVAIERGSQFDVARARFDAAMNDRFQNDPHGREHLAAMHRDMADFEHRMGSTPHAIEQIQRTYTEMAEMLGNNPGVMPQSQRTQIAAQMIHAAAHPDAVSQGWSTSCVAASLETRLLTNEPGSVAALIRQIVTNNAFTAASYDDGPTFTAHLDRDTLLNNRHGNIPAPFAAAGFTERNQFDQIFQSTVRNIALAQHNQLNPGDDYQYRPGPINAEHPMGEYVTNNGAGVSPEHREITFDEDGMSTTDISQIYRQISGRNDPGADLTRLTGAADNVQDFRRQLEEARHGGFPATVGIDTNQEPFRSIMRVPLGRGVGHAITLLGMDSNGNVEYRNSYFGNQVFHITPEQLLDAMHKYVQPEFISGFAEGIGKQTDEQALHHNLVEFLSGLAPSQRLQTLSQLSGMTRRDLSRLLSNDECERLGLGRNFLGRIGHTIGVS